MGKNLEKLLLIEIADESQITAHGVKGRIALTLSRRIAITQFPEHRLNNLLKPLSVFHIKVHEIAMMMTIALRFIPVLLEETDKIMNAQKARGADMESGNIFKRVKALIPVLIPLFVSSFRRANDLAMAMECRCYNGGNGRTRMRVLRFSMRDLWALIFSAVIFAGVIFCNIYFPPVIR